MGVQDIAPSFNNPPTFNDLNEVKKYLKDVVDKVAIALNELDFMVNGNIDLNNIRAKSITADRMKVTELSAISANLGHITAGLVEAVQIFGSYIATAQGTYPRCEMSATDNLFAAYYNANNYIAVEPNYGGSPAINFFTALGLQARINNLLGFELYNTSTTARMSINGGTMGTDMGGNFTFGNWSNIKRSSPASDLQTELNAKANYGAITSASGGGTYNGGIPIGTQLMVSGGGTVTWAGISIPSHSHVQA